MSDLTKEQQALNAFLLACKDRGMDGEAMQVALRSLQAPKSAAQVPESARIWGHTSGLAAPDAADQWRMVPVEPTFEQWQAGSLCLKGHNDTPHMESPVRKVVAIAVYNAMLAASPTKP